MVYGKRVGTTVTVCTDNNCPVHDPRAAARAAEHPAPVMAPAPPEETEEEAEVRRQQFEEEQKAHQQEERRTEERRQEFERQQQEQEAEAAKRDKLRKKREATFERIVAEAPPVFTAAQLRVLLRAFINLDPYTFADDLAAEISEGSDNDENDNRSAEEVLLSAIDSTADDNLTGFAARLALAGHRGIPGEGELDILTEAEAAFLTPKPKKSAAKRDKQAPARKGEPTTGKPTKTAAKKATKEKQPIAA